MSESNTQHQGFIRRLSSRLAETVMPECIAAYLSFKEYQLILKAVYAQAENFKRLKPGVSVPIQKKHYVLPRSITIMRTMDGEYQLIVDTKSKQAGGRKFGKKHKPKVREGSYKIGKPAWRIDSDVPIKKIGFRIKVEDCQIGMDKEEQIEANYKADKAEIMEEVKTSQQLDPRKCTHLFWGGRYHHHDAKGNIHIAIKTYSNFAAYDLNHFLQTEEGNNLSEEAKHRLKLSLLKSIKECHDKGFIHGDISLGNILVFQDEQGHYYLKLCDFGSIAEISNPERQWIRPTAEYASPEVFQASLRTDLWPDESVEAAMILNKEYHRDKPKQIYAAQFHSTQHDNKTLKSYQNPHTANDIWACGIVFHEIDTGVRLTRNSKLSDATCTPLVRQMLTPERIYRIGINDALSMQQEEMSQTIACKPA